MPLFVKEEPREREERLHQRGVLVVGGPRRIDGSAGERSVPVVQKQIKPARVIRRRVEVETLVARVAQGRGSAHEHHEVHQRQHRADGVRLERLRDLLQPRHRRSPSKQ